MHCGVYFLWPVLLCNVRVILSMRLLLPHGQVGWRPSHWVKTECITAEVRFHDKAFRKLTWDYFHPGLSTLFRKFRKKEKWQKQHWYSIHSHSKSKFPSQNYLYSPQNSFYISYYIASHIKVALYYSCPVVCTSSHCPQHHHCHKACISLKCGKSTEYFFPWPD